MKIDKVLFVLGIPLICLGTVGSTIMIDELGLSYSVFEQYFIFFSSVFMICLGAYVLASSLEGGNCNRKR